MPTPLIIDTDPGVDDAVALLLALASPEVEVRAVTTVFGNVPLPVTTANAARLLALAGRDDVPLAAGADRPLVHPQRERAESWHGADGLGGLAAGLPEPAAGPDPRGAVGLMADVLRAAPEPVTVVPIGPLTNVALLLAVHPELTARIGRIVAMGGSLGAGNTTGAAEFNVFSDPEAAHRVFTQAEVPVTLVPLDLTMRCLADRRWLADLAASGPRCAQLAAMIGHYHDAFRTRYGLDAVALHDALAVLEAVVPGTLRTTGLPLRVACDLGPARGVVVADRRPAAPGPQVHVALDADIPAVLSEILTRLHAWSAPPVSA
ncbi:nucleoside hydrolase [Pseudonocardia hispaniensis]|uniref:Nucleoside hydrolase n=1 Tax=Pseudonocardia hispaniensis TaxID=904933 RepID=A0ABW1J7L0_9PSEU